MQFCYYFIMFLIYSILGWILEVIDTLIESKKLVNRGFLIGPYCPIYGVVALFITNFLQNYLDKPLILFILSIVFCSIFEYIVSYVLEKIFNTRWWDYSHKKFNINGRICLENSIPFGIACLIMMYILNPFFDKLISMIPYTQLFNITIICLGLYLFDFFVSLTIIYKLKNISKNVKQDSTEKVTKYVKKELLKTNKKLYTRLITSFPNLKILEKIKKTKN